MILLTLLTNMLSSSNSVNFWNESSYKVCQIFAIISNILHRLWIGSGYLLTLISVNRKYHSFLKCNTISAPRIWIIFISIELKNQRIYHKIFLLFQRDVVYNWFTIANFYDIASFMGTHELNLNKWIFLP